MRTFDGFVYDFKPTTCWTVAAKDCHKDQGWMLLVRSPVGESMILDAKFIDVHRGVVVEYTNHAVKVKQPKVYLLGHFYNFTNFSFKMYK